MRLLVQLDLDALLKAIRLKERDLARFHGDAYLRYRQRVAMLIPHPPRR